MTLTFTYLSHSGFLISDGKHTIAVDPFLTGNPLAKHKPSDINVSAILLSHGHDDHVGDTVEIAKANDATVYAPYELAQQLSSEGVTTDGGNPGGQLVGDFGSVAFTHAFHSSSHSKYGYVGACCGLMISMAGVTIYHCGDTGIFSDMKLLAEIYKPQVALIPIGDRFTMGPALASRAAEMIKPRVAIPIHYNTFPVIQQDPKDFKPNGVTVQIMQPGETWNYT